MTVKSKDSKTMIFSTQNHVMVKSFGQEEGDKLLMDAGYPALDMSFFGDIYSYIFEDDYRQRAAKMKAAASSRGVIYNQAHAPFGGGFENYTTNLIPQFQRVFEFCGLLGVRQIIVHPIQRGQYFGNEKEIFDLNIEFYKSLAPMAKENGVKIAIENMWQRHYVNKQIIDDICADPHELAAMYDTLNDPVAFTVCLDIGHVALCRREPDEAIRILGHDRLGALHVHDVDYVSDLHTLPGIQKINWDKVCQALGEIDYKGELTLEADNFLKNFEDGFKPAAARFMAETARYLADKVDSYRIKS